MHVEALPVSAGSTEVSPALLSFVSQSFQRSIDQQTLDAQQTAEVEVPDHKDSALLSSAQLGTVTPSALAYIGDAVFELYVRSRLLIPQKRIRHYHQQVVDQVNAEQQARYLDCLTPYLNAAEKDIARRGRNATSGRSRRATAQNYQKATGFEALIGFLYLSDQVRLFDLLDRLKI